MKLLSILSAFALTATGALAGEAVPLSVDQDRTSKGCAAHFNYTNRLGSDLTNFGGACGLADGFVLTASTDYSHGFEVKAGANVGIGKYIVASVRASIPVGGLPNALNGFSIEPAVTVHNKNLIGPLGVGAQYSANIPVSGFHVIPTRHTAKAWASLEIVKDKFEAYAIGQGDFYGSNGITCGECSSRLIPASSELRAGGGLNLYTHGLRISGEYTASVDGGPYGSNGRELMFGVTAGI